MATPDEHVEISSRFIAQADAEFAGGDLLQASEKAWGAVAHRLKAIAIRRGWRHGRHAGFYTIVGRLEQEIGRPDELGQMLARADSLHANFYNVFKSESEVRDGIDDVKAFLAVLDRIA